MQCFPSLHLSVFSENRTIQIACQPMYIIIMYACSRELCDECSDKANEQTTGTSEISVVCDNDKVRMNLILHMASAQCGYATLKKTTRNQKIEFACITKKIKCLQGKEMGRTNRQLISTATPNKTYYHNPLIKTEMKNEEILKQYERYTNSVVKHMTELYFSFFLYMS